MIRPGEMLEALELSSSIEVATRLASLGVKVFPCGQDKAPRVSRGFLDASTDLGLVEAWFSTPGLSVGVVPSSCGLAVMDLDVVEGSGLALAAAQVELHTGVDVEDHPHRVMTPSGGCHLWFSIGDKPGPLVANSRWPSVDIRGDGGYVIVWAPNKVYRLHAWDLDSGHWWYPWPIEEPRQLREPSNPASRKELEELIASRRLDHHHSPKEEEYALRVLDGVKEGSRHSAGLKALGRLFGSELDLGQVLPLLEAKWMTLPGPGRGRKEEWEAMVKWIAGQELAKANNPQEASKVPWVVTPEGVREALDAMGFQVRLNARKQRVEVCIPPRLRVQGQGEWCQVNEQVEALLVHTVALECINKDSKAPITSMSRWREWLAWCQVGKAPVDPFIEWLDGLPPWDKEPRADEWLYLFDIAEGTSLEVISYVSRLIPMACVKRALEPGCGADIMPVLVGPQGIGKSRSLKALMADPDWFSDSLSLHDDLKAWVEKSLKPVLIEVAEMAGASRAETAKLKSILSATKDEVRLAYRRDAEEYPRRFFPVGTANDARTLPNDPTGNRRFAVVNLVGNTRENPDANSVVASIEELREQIFAEALHRVKAGESLFPDAITSGYLASAAEGARIDDTEVEAMVNAFLEGRTTKFHVGGLIRESRAWLSPDSGEQLHPRALDARVNRALYLAGCVRGNVKSRGRMEGDGASVVRYWWTPQGAHSTSYAQEEEDHVF